MDVPVRGRAARLAIASLGALFVVTMLLHSDALGSGGSPSLRLMRTDAEVTIQRWGDEVPLDFGTFVAAMNGGFELRVRRTSSGYAVEQVVDGSVVRRLHGSVVDPDGQGLLDFFEIDYRSLEGALVASTRASFCPAGWWQERVDDTGPDSATYPMWSGCWFGPVTKALVWGIDRGWAIGAPTAWGGGPTVADGTYDVTLRIAKRYRDAFGVAPADATTTVRVTIVPGEDHWEEPPIEDPEEGERLGIASHRSHHDPRRKTIPEVQDDASGLPDLVAEPAHNMHTENVDGRDILAFGATVWNAGPGPLVVEGFRRPDEKMMDAYQYFYDKGVKTGRALVGTLEFDSRDGHHHWHFTDFARYQLLSAKGQMVVRSGKEAFCLAPTDAVDLTIPTANWRPGSTGLATACGGERSLWIREILDVGWGDTYHQWLPGQSFDITDVPNGQYLVEVTTNPDGRLQERSASNNRAVRKVTLGGEPGARTIKLG